MFENIRLAFQGVWSHKMRSFLTMLGIIIGIAAIIAIVSGVKGQNEQIKQNLIGSGNNTVDVVLNYGGYEYEISDSSMVPKDVPQISARTLKEIGKLEEVESVTSYNSRVIYENIYYQNSSVSDTQILGVDEQYFKTCGYIMRSGRGFLSDDYKKFRKVVILNSVAAKSLFPSDNPIGKTIEIQRIPFTVIGVATEKSKFQPEINNFEDYSNYATESNGVMYVPKATWPVLFNYDEPENVTVKAVSTDDMTRAGRKTADILNKLIPGTGDNSSRFKYAAKNQMDKVSQLQQFSNSTQIQLILIASISLLVGGIGVMNIMLVSVTERTSEIGLKKAIGARRGTILAQFLTEAAVLSSMGGILGVAAGIGAAQVIHNVLKTPVAIDVPASAIAVLFSMGIGILFGFLPSVQASNLDPIEALRRE